MYITYTVSVHYALNFKLTYTYFLSVPLHVLQVPLPKLPQDLLLHNLLT